MSFGIHVFSHPSLPRFPGTVRERLRDLRRFPGQEHLDREGCRILRGFRPGARRYRETSRYCMNTVELRLVLFVSLLSGKLAFRERISVHWILYPHRAHSARINWTLSGVGSPTRTPIWALHTGHLRAKYRDMRQLTSAVGRTQSTILDT